MPRINSPRGHPTKSRSRIKFQSSWILSKHLIENNYQPLTVHMSTIWFQHTKNSPMFPMSDSYSALFWRLLKFCPQCFFSYMAFLLFDAMTAWVRIALRGLDIKCVTSNTIRLRKVQILWFCKTVLHESSPSWNVRCSDQMNQCQKYLYSVQLYIHITVLFSLIMNQSLFSAHLLICFVSAWVGLDPRQGWVKHTT